MKNTPVTFVEKISYEKSVIKARDLNDIYVSEFQNYGIYTYAYKEFADVADFKLALAKSLLSSVTHEETMFLENLPAHLRANKNEINIEVFGYHIVRDSSIEDDNKHFISVSDQFYYEYSSAHSNEKDIKADKQLTSELGPYYNEYILAHSKSHNSLVANGLYTLYDINSKVHELPESDKINAVEFYKTEIPRQALKSAFLKHLPIFVNSFTNNLKGNVKQNNNHTEFKLYEKDMPDFLFSFWAITSKLPTNHQHLYEKYDDEMPHKLFYNLTYDNQTVKEYYDNQEVKECNDYLEMNNFSIELLGE